MTADDVMPVSTWTSAVTSLFLEQTIFYLRKLLKYIFIDKGGVSILNGHLNTVTLYSKGWFNVQDDVMGWNRFTRYCPFVRESIGDQWIHTKGQYADLFFVVRLKHLMNKLWNATVSL